MRDQLTPATLCWNQIHFFIFLHWAIMPCANIDSESQSSVTASNISSWFSSLIFPDRDLSCVFDIVLSSVRLYDDECICEAI